MSTVGDVAGSVLDKYQIKNETKTNKDLGKNEFLNLLVAQLNNQNPLEPQGNGEFIAQLAQFSQVEGIEKLNTSMGSLLTGYQSSQALQADCTSACTLCPHVPISQWMGQIMRV